MYTINIQLYLKFNKTEYNDRFRGITGENGEKLDSDRQTVPWPDSKLKIYCYLERLKKIIFTG